MPRKTIEQFRAEASKQGMAKVLGPLSLITIGMGAIIGAGIFVITGHAAADYAGPAITLSFVFSGIACIFAGLCYAELASLIPVSGSAYTYAHAALGSFMGWIIGWDLILEYLIGATTVAVGWSAYVNSFFADLGLALPGYLSNSPLNVDEQGRWFLTGSLCNLPAMFIVALLSWVIFLGVHRSALLNATIVTLKLSIIALFLIIGIYFVHPENWTPFIPPNEGTFGSFGWSGVLRGAGVVFFAYIGFDSVSTMAQEARNPQRDITIGIFGSLAISTVCYILMAAVLTGVVPYTELKVDAPIALAVDRFGQHFFWLRPIIKIGAIAGLTSVILVYLMGQARLFMAMAKDGMLPHFFQVIHPTFRTPYKATLFTGVAACAISGIFPIDILGQMVSIGTLLAFFLVSLSVLVLRRTRPDLHRPFKTPFVPLVPILGALTALAQMVALPTAAIIRLFVWMAIGLVVYKVARPRRSGYLY